MAMQHFIYSKECILLRKQSTKFIDVSEREQKYQSFLTKKNFVFIDNYTWNSLCIFKNFFSKKDRIYNVFQTDFQLTIE